MIACLSASGRSLASQTRRRGWSPPRAAHMPAARLRLRLRRISDPKRAAGLGVKCPGSNQPRIRRQLISFPRFNPAAGIIDTVVKPLTDIRCCIADVGQSKNGGVALGIVVSQKNHIGDTWLSRKNGPTTGG